MPDTSASRVVERHRTTIYLEQEDLASLDELKAYYRRHYGRRLDRSQAIREAIRYFHREFVAPARIGEEAMDR